MKRRRNADDRLRQLERAFNAAPSLEALERLNIEQQRSSLPANPRLFTFGEGWQMQTTRGTRKYSSATLSHDGWWGISHATWDDAETPGWADKVGDTKTGPYPGPKPTKEEVLLAHQRVFGSYGDYGTKTNPRKRRKNADDKLRRLERIAGQTQDATDILAYWKACLRAGILPAPTHETLAPWPNYRPYAGYEKDTTAYPWWVWSPYTADQKLGGKSGKEGSAGKPAAQRIVVSIAPKYTLNEGRYYVKFEHPGHEMRGLVLYADTRENAMNLVKSWLPELLGDL